MAPTSTFNVKKPMIEDVKSSDEEVLTYEDEALLSNIDGHYGHGSKKGVFEYPHLELNHGNTTEQPPGPTVIVRGEEIGIVLVVLLLWIGAIALFFNRWGKIRMLEPYQPKFCETHRPSCPIADVTPITHFPRTLSKFNLSNEGSPHFAKCTYNNYNYHPVGVVGYGMGGGTSVMTSVSTSSPFPSSSSPNNAMTTSSIPHHINFPALSSSGTNQRPRQNSVFSTALPPLKGYIKNTSRKTRSAVDLSNLILSEEFIENVRQNSKNSITHL